MLVLKITEHCRVMEPAFILRPGKAIYYRDEYCSGVKLFDQLRMLWKQICRVHEWDQGTVSTTLPGNC